MENKEYITVECIGDDMVGSTNTDDLDAIYAAIYDCNKNYKLELTVFYGTMVIMMAESIVSPLQLYKDIKVDNYYSLRDIGYVMKREKAFYLPYLTMGLILSIFRPGLKRKVVMGDSLIKMDVYIDGSDEKSYNLITQRCNFDGSLKNKRLFYFFENIGI